MIGTAFLGKSLRKACSSSKNASIKLPVVKTVLIHEYCQMSSDKTYAMTMRHFTEEPYEGKLSRTVLETSANREICA